MNESRRTFLKKGSLLALAGLTSSVVSNAFTSVLDPGPHEVLHEPFSLPALPYGYDGLEPHIDKMTMEIHHDKHHKGYVDNLNKAIAEGNIHATLDELITGVSKYATAIRNNAGGHWNHSFFWKLMKPNGGGAPNGKVAAAINEAFGSFDDFRSKFEDAGAKRFGSGWAWLVVDNNKKFAIGSTPNQDNPMMDIADFKGKPVLGIDVWEHAYYLKYQNKRGDYLKAWWNVVNWDEVNRNFDAAMK